MTGSELLQMDDFRHLYANRIIGQIFIIYGLFQNVATWPSLTEVVVVAVIPHMLVKIFTPELPAAQYFLWQLVICHFK